jgi:hypothetical protein
MAKHHVSGSKVFQEDFSHDFEDSSSGQIGRKESEKGSRTGGVTDKKVSAKISAGKVMADAKNKNVRATSSGPPSTAQDKEGRERKVSPADRSSSN